MQYPKQTETKKKCETVQTKRNTGINARTRSKAVKSKTGTAIQTGRFTGTYTENESAKAKDEKHDSNQTGRAEGWRNGRSSNSTYLVFDGMQCAMESVHCLNVRQSLPPGKWNSTLSNGTSWNKVQRVSSYQSTFP